MSCLRAARRLVLDLRAVYKYLVNLMGQPRVFPLANRALGGTLERRLRKQREQGSTYRAIARDLAEDGIHVSGETVRKWCLDLGIEAA